MRTIPAIILTATLFCSSYAGTVTLTSQSWVAFHPISPYDFSCTVYHDSSNEMSCSSIKDSTDFYWTYYVGCVCNTCLCCPSIAAASKRPFYVSRKAWDCIENNFDTATLADTTLFIKCTTSVTPHGISCPFPLSFSSANLLLGPYGLFPSLDSLYTRLLVVRTRFSNYPPLRYVPLKIDRVVYNPVCLSGSFAVYDSMHVTYGSTLACTDVHARVAPASRGALHVAKTGAGYVISGFGKGRSSLEIVNGRGKTVYYQPVFSSSCMVKKDILGPGLYIVNVRSREGAANMVFPVY